MIHFVGRVLLISIGVFAAIPYYATALTANGEQARMGELLRALAIAFLCTLVAAIGVVGF